MHPWLYALACVAAPLLWALLMFRLVSYLEARATPPATSPTDLPPPDYSI